MRNHRSHLAGLLALAALVAAFPAAASAQDADAAAAALTVSTQKTYPFGNTRAIVAGEKFTVRGQSRGGPGNVIVRVRRGGKVVLTERPRVGAGGAYRQTIKLGRPGVVRIEVVRAKSPGGAAARAKPFSLFVANPGARSGASMRFLQQRLAAMGYWPTQSGRYDLRTRWAVLAYRKVNRMPRTFTLNALIFKRVVRGAGRFKPRYGATGRKRVEAHIARQVVALISARGQVVKIVPTSSGAPGTRSDIGRFRFWMKRPGTSAIGMVNSAFYNGGEAIHGYPSVPMYPASHGCLRIPTTYSRAVMNWVSIGDRIDVYR